MRESRFWELMNDEFGVGYAHVLVDTLVLEKYPGTAAEALKSGIDPKQVWAEICKIQEIPAERHFGIQKEPKS